MCRRYSRGSKDIGGVGENMRPDERREGLGRHQLDSTSEQPLQQFCQSNEAVEALELRVELDQQVDIAVRPRLTPEHRAEERQPAHTKRPDLGFGGAQAGNRLVPGQRSRSHRFNLRAKLWRANRGWRGTVGEGLAATLEARLTADAARLGSGYARRSSFGVRSPTAATDGQARCCRGSSRKRPFELLQRERRSPLRLRGYRWPKRSPLLLKDLGVVRLRRR